MTYPESIMKDLRELYDLEDNDKSKDDQIVLENTPNEVFNKICDYNGYIRGGYRIKSWIKDIYGIDLDKVVKKE